MSCCHVSVAQEARAGTARVLVTELSGSGLINPSPASKPCEESEPAVEPYLSPETLKSLCGTQDLAQVTSLEICVDTRETTLSRTGAYLPKLEQLKMNNSIITSVRDLGTTLSHLQVLSMLHCCLQDLTGISKLSSLKELYMAYNSVSDLSQVGMLENLQLLDLEGNEVDDLVQVQYLGLCGKLQKLTLEGNPVCVRPNPAATQTAYYSYRHAVRELIPQLCYLDSVRVEDSRLSCAMGEDWAILLNSIRDCNSSPALVEDEGTVDGECTSTRPSSARHPASSLSCVWSSRPTSATRSGILSPPASRPGSSDSDLAVVEAETSILTHGAGNIVFCGNPVKAIRAKRKKLMTAPAESVFTHHNLPVHVAENTYDHDELDGRDQSDVFAELRAWREQQHHRRIQATETDIPQVLTIQHSEEGDREGEDEDSFMSDSSDEEEEEHIDIKDTMSSDSSFLSLSPDTPKTPSPPLSATAPTANRRPPGVRARRLLLSQVNAEPLLHSSTSGCSFRAAATRADTGLTIQGNPGEMSASEPLLPLLTLTPLPPGKTTSRGGLMESRAKTDLSGVQSHIKHQMMSRLAKQILN
ncbi:leucine-rich repeat-containing protein 56 [Thalassophryne amazonica]|uniref:leucine-rich repeat-containing protein 56 n=1 Tax=Thalassophryne amazonica TaxID=390379 RepID=UPI001471F90E|nr:leucine-rich repeat-containing protein 56 [Thalassophryne amazonica]